MNRLYGIGLGLIAGGILGQGVLCFLLLDRQADHRRDLEQIRSDAALLRHRQAEAAEQVAYLQLRGEAQTVINRAVIDNVEALKAGHRTIDRAGPDKIPATHLPTIPRDQP